MAGAGEERPPATGTGGLGTTDHFSCIFIFLFFIWADKWAFYPHQRVCLSETLLIGQKSTIGTHCKQLFKMSWIFTVET
jgi:hypothetical protein